MCSCTDVYSRRIPNWLICTGLLTGVLVRSSGGVLGGVSAAFRCAAVLCILFPIFLCRMAGAGDIKMTAVLAGIAGYRAAALIVAAGLVAAAPVCLVKLLVRRNLKERLIYFFAYVRHTVLTKQIKAYHDPRQDGYGGTIPMAIFLFLGYWYYIHTGGKI